jgi:hypothetical protein
MMPRRGRAMLFIFKLKSPLKGTSNFVILPEITALQIPYQLFDRNRADLHDLTIDDVLSEAREDGPKLIVTHGDQHIERLLPILWTPDDCISKIKDVCQIFLAKIH